MDVELEGLEQVGNDSQRPRTPRHTTTAHSEAPQNLHDEDADIVADLVDREAFPDLLLNHLEVDRSHDMSKSNLIERSTEAARHINLLIGSTVEHVLYVILIVKTLMFGHCPEYSTASRAVVSKGTDELDHLLIVLSHWVATPGPNCPA